MIVDCLFTNNINNIIVFEKHANKACRTAAIVWASILAPCHEVMSLRLDFIIDYQDIDSSNGRQGDISNGFLPSSDTHNITQEAGREGSLWTLYLTYIAV